jgi:DNA mismatch repair protein MutS2
LINEPLETKKQRSVQVKMDSDRKPIDPKLDIRGLPKSEAARLLDEYFDQIILQGLSSVQIVHGKGSGVLKQLVREKAKKYGAFTELYHPLREAGGEGVSILKT